MVGVFSHVLTRVTVFNLMINYLELEYFLESLNLYSGLLAVVLTIAVAYLALRSLRSQQQSLRLSMLPIFSPRVFMSAQGSTLALENYSNYPAYDVDLWIIGIYYQHDIPYKSLLGRQYKSKTKISFSRGLYSLKWKDYGVVDHITHYAFPPESRCVMDLNFVTPPDSLQLVLQFRDTMKNNYLHQSWLFKDKSSHMEEALKLGALKTSFKPAKRINYCCGCMSSGLDSIFKFTDFIFLPKRVLRLIPIAFSFYIVPRIRAYLYLDKNVKDILLRSFPSGYQKKNKGLSIEGRGVFTQH